MKKVSVYVKTKATRRRTDPPAPTYIGTWAKIIKGLKYFLSHRSFDEEGVFLK